jgi:hypothetical protein
VPVSRPVEVQSGADRDTRCRKPGHVLCYNPLH